MDSAKFLDALIEAGAGMFCGVPDSLLQDFCACLTDRLPPSRHVIAANEGAAVALAVGSYLATGQAGVVYLQNSGLGNTVNPLLSLADREVYRIPMILIIGWRGEPGVKDEPQHVKQGRVTRALLDAMEIETIVIDETTQIEDLHGAIRAAVAEQRQLALLVRKGAFAKYPATGYRNAYPLVREQAIATILAAAPPRSLVVATTGHIGREVYEYRVSSGADPIDFLTVGGMGHASSIALAIAMELPERTVICIDGDGAVLMHMGALATIGSRAPKNLAHFVLNNGAHVSVGSQPTVAFDASLPEVARACGYPVVEQVFDRQGLRAVLDTDPFQGGPCFVEVRVNTEVRGDLGRPKTTPLQNRDAFMADVARQP